MLNWERYKLKGSWPVWYSSRIFQQIVDKLAIRCQYCQPEGRVYTVLPAVPNFDVVSFMYIPRKWFAIVACRPVARQRSGNKQL
jgi:hypothetical protein